MGRRKKDLDFWETTKSTAHAYLLYYRQLLQIALAVAKWNNLPKTIDPVYLERILISDGRAIFFKDEAIGYMVSRVELAPPYDQNDQPMRRIAYSQKNSYRNELNEDNSIIIRNNYLSYPSKIICDYYANKLYRIDKTMDINVNAQKTPILILCDENEKLTLKNLYMKYEGGEPFIFGDKKLSSKPLQVLNTNAPYLVDKLQSAKMSIWSEAMSFLGVSNVSYIKTERLTQSESIQSQGATYSMRANIIGAREADANKINAMFPDLDVSCEFNTEITKELYALNNVETEIEAEEEGGEHE